MKEDKNRGFTLVELICVIAILGILMSAALPAYASVLASARTAAAHTETEILADGIQRFLDDQMEAGTLTSRILHRVMGADLEDPDNLLSDYVSVSQEGARIYSVTVDMNSGRLKELIYETKYNRTKLVLAEDGTRTIEDLDVECAPGDSESTR